jgi:putative transposase
LVGYVPSTRQHSETRQTPIDRFTSQRPLQAVEPSLLREAFRWSVLRRVTSTASISLAGNRYAVDPSLIGRRIELRFDPEDRTRLDVFWEGRPVGQPPAPRPSTGVDYLGLVVAERDQQMLGQIAYRDLPRAAQEMQP